jgi:hypothetical protein
MQEVSQTEKPDVPIGTLSEELYISAQHTFKNGKKLYAKMLETKEIVERGGSRNCFCGCFVFLVVQILCFLFMRYMIIFNGAVMKSPNDPIAFTDGPSISDASCLNLLQGIRSSYYKNSGEYRCIQQPQWTLLGGNRDLQCIETFTTIEFLVFKVCCTQDYFIFNFRH